MKERRSSEIYMSFREARQQIEQQAKEVSKKIEHDWEEQGWCFILVVPTTRRELTQLKYECN